MKRELDPFESKLKEKLQGKAQFPEDILWKRLNDELLRSDQQVASKNRYWILGAAMLVFISLGTGYFIGMRQGASKQIADNSLNTGTKQKLSQNTESSLNQRDSKRAPLQVEKIIRDETALNNISKSLHLDAKNVQPKKTKQDRLSSIKDITVFDSRNQSNSIPKEVSSSSSIRTIEKINQDRFSSSQLLISTNSKNIPLIEIASDVNNLKSEESTTYPVVFENDFILDKLFIQHITLLPTSAPASLAKGTPYKKHLPTFLSASVGLEQTVINRLQTDRIYGSVAKNSINERGQHSTNLKFGFQAQLGRHLEIGTGLGTFTYSTQQIAKNQIVKIDQLQNQLNFESSISSFEIHEDDLFDDPEDQEENELNFEDSTSIHLNYQISNTIKSIQIPITAGFVFQVNKCKVSMKTGLIFNHMTQANQDVNISGFNAIRTDVQSKLISNSFYQLFQVGAEFPVSDHVFLMLAPSYCQALKSISKSSVLRPNSLGLECALKFYF